MGPISGLGKEFDKAMKLLITGSLRGERLLKRSAKNSLKEKMLSVMASKLKIVFDESGDYTRAEGYEEAIEDVKKVFRWAENQKDK